MHLSKINCPIPGNIPRSATLLVLFASCIWLPAPLLFSQEQDDHADEGAHDEHVGHEDEDEVSSLIRFTDEQIKDFGIIIEEAGEAELSVQTVLPGEVKLDQENMAHVGPRYDGVVTKISARLGDRVTVGQVLAELQSNETLAPFNVVAPIDGTIVDIHITLGESFEAGRYLFIVADLNSVWVDLDIFQKDLGRISKGQKVLVKTGRESFSAEGTIEYVGPVVNEETRTGLARVILPNSGGKWKPGMFVTGYVATDRNLVTVAVKRTAIQTLDGQNVVFVRIPGGFKQRPVLIGRQDALYAEILSGVGPGELYASERSFIVKAQKEKAGIDPHAGHNH